MGWTRVSALGRRKRTLVGWDALLAFFFVVNIFVAPEHHARSQPFLLHPALEHLH